MRYSFEQEFNVDIWSKLTKRLASNMSLSLVALASFIGNCTHYKLINFGICFPILSLTDDLNLFVREARLFACIAQVYS